MKTKTSQDDTICKNCGHPIEQMTDGNWMHANWDNHYEICKCDKPEPKTDDGMDNIKPTNNKEEANVEYGCCARCGKALPKAILRPFKGRRPSAKLFCPECTSALVDSLERSMP